MVEGKNVFEIPQPEARDRCVADEIACHPVKLDPRIAAETLFPHFAQLHKAFQESAAAEGKKRERDEDQRDGNRRVAVFFAGQTEKHPVSETSRHQDDETAARAVLHD